MRPDPTRLFWRGVAVGAAVVLFLLYQPRP